MPRTTVQDRIANANIEMVFDQDPEINYTHAALCQVGLPRSNRADELIQSIIDTLN